jgi:WhiB family redox-sensing transcriptional regulator
VSATTLDAGAPAGQVEPWHGARALPAGPWRNEHEWMRRAACRAPGVDPDWFTVDEDAPEAPGLIAKAKQVCRGCPVRLWCRIHADETGEYGVYATETHTERVRRQHAWQLAVAHAEAAEQAVSA